jgi:hypothetical protein
MENKTEERVLSVVERAMMEVAQREQLLDILCELARDARLEPSLRIQAAEIYLKHQ